MHAFSLSKTSVKLKGSNMKTKNSFKLEMLAHNTAHPAVKNAHRGPLTVHFARCAVIKLESVASNDCASKIIHRRVGKAVCSVIIAQGPIEDRLANAGACPL